MALFDTDILIYHLRGKKEAKEVLLNFKNEKNYCSVITTGEILFSMKDGEERNTFSLLDNLEEIPVEREIIRGAYEIKKRAKGYELQLYDCIICATALKLCQTLVTFNVKHYPDKRIKIFLPEY